MLDELRNDLDKHLYFYENFIITGDLNCNLLRSGYEAEYLRNFAGSFALHIIPSGPTYHTSHSDSLLDVVITDDAKKVKSFSKSHVPFIAGHDIIRFEYVIRDSQSSNRYIFRRNFKNFVNADFCNTVQSRVNDITTVSLPACENENKSDLDRYVSHIANIILFSLDQHTPLRKLRVSRPPSPWLTDQIKLLMRRRDRLYKQAKRANSVLGYAVYREFRNRLVRVIRYAQESYQFDRLNSINHPSDM